MNMIEWLIGFALLVLVASHANLTYSCFKMKPWVEDSLNDFHGSLGHVRNDVSHEFSNLSHVVTHGVELIDELVQVLADATPSQPAGSGGIMEVFLSSLMNRNPMGSDYGPQDNIRTIQETDSPPTLETEDELNELSS